MANVVIVDHMKCVKAGRLYLYPPYLAFASVDRKSARFTIPLSTVRRVERLNTRTGVFALSLTLWHGMKIVRCVMSSFYFIANPQSSRLYN